MLETVWEQWGKRNCISSEEKYDGAANPAAEVGASAQRKGQCLLTQQQLPGPPAAQEEHRKLTPVSRRATPNPPYYVTPSYKAQWKYCHTYYTSPSRLLWDHTHSRITRHVQIYLLRLEEKRKILINSERWTAIRSLDPGDQGRYSKT